MEDPICGVAFPDFKAAFLPSLFPALFPLPLSSVLLFMQNNRMTTTTTTESFNAATEWRTDCARRSCLSLSNLHLPRGSRFLRGFFLSHVYLVSFLAPHQSMFWRLALTQTCASLSFIRLRFCVACRGGKKSRRSCKNLTHSLSFLPSFHDSISIPNPSKLASYKRDALSFLLTHARRVCGRDCALTCVCVCVLAVDLCVVLSLSNSYS